MSPKSGIVWEDKEILFDLPISYLRLRAGEKIFDRIEYMEDTKGNNGVKGRMTITSLRIIWHAVASPRINLSIGLNCLQTVTTRAVTSGLRGATQALYLLGSYRGNKYEFIFTNLCLNSTRHYTSVLGVYKAYVNSRIYRDLKLRGAFIQNKQLKMLPLEKISLSHHGVWNLSSDTGNLGTMIITNIRVIWFADINDTFNVSLPYIAIASTSLRDSKFGQALVLTAQAYAGGYVLGFRIDPHEKMNIFYKELVLLHDTYTKKPIFGVQYDWSQAPSVLPQEDELENIEEVGEPRGEMGPNLYLASQMPKNDDNSKVTPIFSTFLGLAIEPLKPGFTLQTLWEVQPSS